MALDFRLSAAEFILWDMSMLSPVSRAEFDILSIRVLTQCHFTLQL